MRLVHRAHVGTPGLQIVGVNEDDALAGGNRLTARIRFVGLIVNHSVNVVVDFVSLDISRRARHAIAADDDIVLLVPLHVLAVQNPLAGIFVSRLFLFRFRVEHAGAKQTNARSAHRGRFQELLTRSRAARRRRRERPALQAPHTSARATAPRPRPGRRKGRRAGAPA